MIVPQMFTKSDLVRLLHWYNLGYCAFGTIIVVIAFIFWLVTIYISMICSTLILLPFQFLGGMDNVLPILLLCVVTGAGWFSFTLFFTGQYDNEFPAIKKSLIWFPVNPGYIMFPLMICCAAPLWTGWGISIFRQCFSYNRSRILLAWTLYCYLNDWNNWVAYPQFESQRQAIFLLYRLNLVRVSYRFGKLQVKRKKM
ncbi:MAG: hypothetical protein LBI18_08510 [Planctomycetaceae bacterium]|nr:hypothetical protein [Planctomycetaceae bacterium]